MLAYLAERRGVDLRRSRHEAVASALTQARGSTFLVLGEEHLPLAGRLSEAEANATTEELTTFAGASGSPEAMREGIQFLRRALEAVTPGTVVLLAIL